MSHQNWVEGNIPLPSTSETYLNLLATLLLIQPSGFLCHRSVLVAHSQFYCPVEHPGPSLQGCFHAISGNVLHWLLHTIFLHMPMEINTEMRKKHHQVKHTVLKAFTNPLGPLCHMQFLFLSQWKKKKKLSKCSLERILFEPKLCASTLLCCLRIEMAGAPSSFSKQAMVKREWQFTLLNKQIGEWLPWEQAMVCLEGFNFPTEHFHSPSEFYSHLINLLSYQTTWNRFWRFLTAN